MTTPNHPTHGQPTAWHTYLTATHAARDHYLNITHQAHLMLLTGPFPDRAGYQRVENTAWESYYTAARAAWEQYTAAMACPCCTSGGDDCTCRTACGNPRCQMADPPQHARAKYHPTDGGNH